MHIEWTRCIIGNPSEAGQPSTVYIMAEQRQVLVSPSPLSLLIHDIGSAGNLQVFSLGDCL